MTLVDLAQLNRALAERDAARAEVARLRAAVEGLLGQWHEDVLAYPKTREGVVADVTVRLCGNELRAALAALDTTDEASP